MKRLVIILLCAVCVGSCGDDEECDTDGDCALGEVCAKNECVQDPDAESQDSQGRVNGEECDFDTDCLSGYCDADTSLCVNDDYDSSTSSPASSKPCDDWADCSLSCASAEDYSCLDACEAIYFTDICKACMSVWYDCVESWYCFDSNGDLDTYCNRKYCSEAWDRCVTP